MYVLHLVTQVHAGNIFDAALNLWWCYLHSAPLMELQIELLLCGVNMFCLKL